MNRLPRATVLAGGRSSRFGSDKACAEIDGRTLVQICVSELAELFERIIIVTKQGHVLPIEPDKQVRIIYEASPTHAAMIGLAEGLRRSDRQLNYVTGCDMPLGAFYSRKCIGIIDEMIISEDYRLSHLVQKLNKALLPYPEVISLDPALRSFCNINTPEDINRASLLPNL